MVECRKGLSATLQRAREILGWLEGKPHAQSEARGMTDRRLRTAQRLMAIARHPVISNSAHGRNLPAPWRSPELDAHPLTALRNGGLGAR